MALTRRIYRPLPRQGVPVIGKILEWDSLHLLRRERQNHGLDLPPHACVFGVLAGSDVFPRPD